jgi:hypothetical protein
MEKKMRLTPKNVGDLALKELVDGIYLIENFITDEEHLYLLDVCRSATEKQWSDSYMETLYGEVEYRYGKEELVNIQNHVNNFWLDKCISVPDLDLSFRLANRLTSLMGELDYLLVKPFINIQRQYTGVALPEHHDQAYDEKITFASVLYLNEDFVDGELYFPDKKLSYRFPEKSLVVFAAGPDFIHGVKSVGSGPTRYVITSFIWDN